MGAIAESENGREKLDLLILVKRVAEVLKKSKSTPISQKLLDLKKTPLGQRVILVLSKKLP